MRSFTLCIKAAPLWHRRCITLSPAYLPRVQNLLTDCLSRHFPTNRRLIVWFLTSSPNWKHLSLIPFHLSEEQISVLRLGKGFDGRCPTGVMERSPAVYIPSHSIDITSYMEDQPRQSSIHPYYAQLDETVLVYGSTKVVSSPIYEHSHISRHSNTAQGQIQALQSGTGVTQGLVF